MTANRVSLVRQRLEELGCRPEGESAFCPSCERDGRHATRSFSFGQGHDLYPVLCCHKQCDYPSLTEALDLPVGVLRPSSMNSKSSAAELGKPIAEYPYRDIDGRLLWMSCRYQPKAFRPRMPDGSPRMPPKGERVPYRLPDLVQAVHDKDPIFVVEGEKNVEKLVEAGLVATCAPLGCTGWQDRFAAEYFNGAGTMVVIPDNDDAGRKYASQVVASLIPVADEVRYLELPDLDEGGDVADWLGSKGDIVDMLKLVNEAVPVTEVPSPAVALEHGATTATAPGLSLRSITELASLVRGRAPRQWLVQGLWPQGAYGVLHGPPKSQKSWTALELAVSVAAARPWFGRFAIDVSGPVVIFSGEGDEGSLLRRLQACAAAAGAEAEDLPIYVSTAAPRLGDERFLQDMEEAIALLRPALVIVDPLYLAAPNADMRDLFAMGAILGGPQRICQAVGASLLVVHHDNRSDKHGPMSATGAGPAEWARVIISTKLKEPKTDADTLETRSTVTMQFTGGEIANQSVVVARRVWADDPDALDSPLNIDSAVVASASAAPDGKPSLSDVQDLMLSFLKAHGRPATSSEVHGAVEAAMGTTRDISGTSRNLTSLKELGLVERHHSGGRAALWRLTAPGVPRPKDADQADTEAPADVNPSIYVVGRATVHAGAEAAGRTPSRRPHGRPG